jgi:WD40 repeat protein
VLEPLRADDVGVATCLAFSQDGKLLAIGGGKGGILLWDLDKGKRKMLQGSHAGVVWSVQFDLSEHLFSGGLDNRIRVWNVEDGKEVEGKGTAYMGNKVVHGIAYHSAQFPKVSLLASGGSNDVILWDPGNQQRFGALVGHQTTVDTVAFSQDGKLLASAGADRTILLWDVDHLRQIGPPLNVPDGFPPSDQVPSLAFTPDGKYVVACSGAAYRWEVAGWRHLGRALTREGDPIDSLAFRPDGKALALGGYSGVFLLNVAGGKEEALGLPDPPNQDYIADLVFSRNGTALISRSRQGVVSVCDVANRCWKRLNERDQAVASVAVSPDGEVLAIGGKEGLVVFHGLLRAGNRGQKIQLYDKPVSYLAFSPDGNALAFVNDPMPPKHYSLLMCNLATREIKELSQDSIQRVVFSPDGKLLAALEETGTITLRDAVGLRRLGTFGKHEGGLHQFAFSPTGEFLASSGREGTVILWDVAGVRMIGSPIQVEEPNPWLPPSVSIAFSPDSKALAIVDKRAPSDNTSTVILLDVDRNSWFARAKRSVRLLSQAEREQYRIEDSNPAGE